MIAFLQVIHILICVFLICVILMQSGKGQGLSGAFGSFAGGAAQNVFGARTGDVLTKITTWFAIFFCLSAVIVGIVQSKYNSTVLKDYRAPVSEVPTQVANSMKQKMSELTDNLLKTSEQKKDSLPTNVGTTPIPTTPEPTTTTASTTTNPQALTNEIAPQTASTSTSKATETEVAQTKAD